MARHPDRRAPGDGEIAVEPLMNVPFVGRG